MIKNQKNIVDELFSPTEIIRMKQFKAKALPSLSKELKDNPDDSKFIMASALEKKQLLNNDARQTLMRLEEPLVVDTVEPESPVIQSNESQAIDSMVMEAPMNTGDLQTSIDSFQVPTVGGNIFSPNNTLSPQQMLSPTVLPNEDDREIAMRQQMGIAGLV